MGFGRYPLSGTFGGNLPFYVFLQEIVYNLFWFIGRDLYQFYSSFTGGGVL
jgi:hypothetical protein